MGLKVIQWATGTVGRHSVECILEHPELELVGCYVHSPEKAGVDVGDIVGIDPVGITTTNSIDEILALDADAVMYAPLLPSGKDVSALLRCGKNVVTPVGWIYPEPKDIDRMNDACLAGGATLHGTGIDPGGVTDILPLMLSAMSSGVTFIRGEEISDIRSYGSPDVIRDVMLFGATPEETGKGPMGELLNAAYLQSIRMMTDTLGVPWDDVRVERIHETAVATQPIDSPIGTIEPGGVAAQRFFWDAYVGDHKIARVGIWWLMGDEHLDPPWEFGEQKERFEMEVRGDPDTHVVLSSWHPKTWEEGLIRSPSLVATAAHCVNAIPYVVAAEPGVRTSVDLPVVAGRAHSSLLGDNR